MFNSSYTCSCLPQVFYTVYRMSACMYPHVMCDCQMYIYSSFDPEFRCARAVSTVLCVHDVQCLDPSCSSHGSCDQGRCSCYPPWIGHTCDRLNCSLVNCSGYGSCNNITGNSTVNYRHVTMWGGVSKASYTLKSEPHPYILM